jgi:hypothetical protein
MSRIAELFVTVRCAKRHFQFPFLCAMSFAGVNRQTLRPVRKTEPSEGMRCKIPGRHLTGSLASEAKKVVVEVALLVEIHCPACNKSTRVPEPILLEIGKYLQGGSTDIGLLMLVCTLCKSSFPFDLACRWDKVIGIADMPLDENANRAWFVISGECSNSCPSTTLIAIRPFGTASTKVEAEFPVCKRQITCGANHKLVTLSIRAARHP